MKWSDDPVNTRTNLAYNERQTVSYPSQHPYTSPNVRIKVSKKKDVQAQKRVHASGIVKLFLLAACAFLVLFRGVMITDRSNNVNQKQEKLNALITSNEKLQFEIDRSLDLKNVETIARDELGMRRTEKYQTIYLDMAQSDCVEKVAKNEFSIVSRVGEFLVAYLD